MSWGGGGGGGSAGTSGCGGNSKGAGGGGGGGSSMAVGLTTPTITDGVQVGDGEVEICYDNFVPPPVGASVGDNWMVLALSLLLAVAGVFRLRHRS